MLRHLYSLTILGDSGKCWRSARLWYRTYSYKYIKTKTTSYVLDILVEGSLQILRRRLVTS